MSTTHLFHRVRVKLDPCMPGGQNDEITGAAPLTWRGKTSRFECGVYVNNVFIDTVKDQYTALTLRLYTNLDGAPVVEKAGTLPAANITEAEWITKAADKTHVTFELTAAEMDLVIDNATEDKQLFILVVYGTVVTSSAEVVLGLAKVYLMKSGPDLTPDAVAQVVRLRNGSIFFKNRTTGSWHEMIVDGAAGQERISLGAALETI